MPESPGSPPRPTLFPFCAERNDRRCFSRWTIRGTLPRLEPGLHIAMFGFGAGPELAGLRMTSLVPGRRGRIDLAQIPSSMESRGTINREMRGVRRPRTGSSFYLELSLTHLSDWRHRLSSASVAHDITERKARRGRPWLRARDPRRRWRPKAKRRIPGEQ